MSLLSAASHVRVLFLASLSFTGEVSMWNGGRKTFLGVGKVGFWVGPRGCGRRQGDSNRKWDVYLSNGSCAGSPSKITIENIHLIHEAIILTIISRAMGFVKPWRVFLTEMCQITQYLHFNHLRVKFHLLNLIKSMPFPHAHSLGSN